MFLPGHFNRNREKLFFSSRFDPATGQQANASFGEFTAARSPRIMQLAVRFTF